MRKYLLMLVMMLCFAMPAFACDFSTYGPNNWPPLDCVPYASTSPFNRRIPSNPTLLSNSAAIVSRVISNWTSQVGAGHPLLQASYAIAPGGDCNDAIFWGASTDGVYTITSATCSESQLWGTTLHIPSAARPGGNIGYGGCTDHHITIVDKLTKIGYDFYQAFPEAGVSGGGGATFSDHTSDNHCGATNVVTGSATGDHVNAGHTSSAAGMIRGPELQGGIINHALFLTVSCDSGTFNYPTLTPSYYTCTNPTNAPPLGSHFYLDYTDAQITALGLPAWERTIVTALAHYGGFVLDQEGPNSNAFIANISIESGETYAAYGAAQPIVQTAEAQGVGFNAGLSSKGGYIFTLAGIDYANHLHVLDPCVAQGTCGTAPPPPPPPPSTQNQYYVSTAGSDSNDGSKARPWKTILHADASIALGTAGTIVHVLPGQYDLSASSGVGQTTKKGGTSSSARVIWLSDTYHGAKINATGSNTGGTLWIVQGDWVQVIDFEMAGNGLLSTGILLMGNYQDSLGNYVHNFNNGTPQSTGAITQSGNIPCGHVGCASSVWHGGVVDRNWVIDSGPVRRSGDNCAIGAGIYLGFPGTVMTNNIVGRVGTFGVLFNGVGYATIANNLSFNTGCGGIGIAFGHDHPEDVPAALAGFTTVDYVLVENNISINNGTTVGLSLGGNGSGGVCTNDHIGSHIVIRNNVMYGNNSNYSVCTGSGYSPPSPISSSNPAMFVNYQDSALGDDHLIAGSPAIAAGSTQCLVTGNGVTLCPPKVDSAGSAWVTRDIGPYAFNGTVLPPSFAGIDDFPDAGGAGACAANALWCWEHDAATIGTAVGTSALVTSPSTDGQARKFSFNWTNFGGIRYHTTLGLDHLDSTSVHFTYDTKIWINDISRLNAIELDYNQVTSDGHTVIVGLQCELVRGIWQYATNVSGSPHWNDTSATCPRSVWTPAVWHHVTLNNHRDGSGNVTYETATLDGVTQTINATGNSSFALGWSPIGVQVVNLQLDGDANPGSAIVFLDNFTVTGGASNNVPPPVTGLTITVH